MQRNSFSLYINQCWHLVVHYFHLWPSVLNFLFKMKVESMVLILLFGFYMEGQSSWTPYPVEEYDYKCHRQVRTIHGKVDCIMDIFHFFISGIITSVTMDFSSVDTFWNLRQNPSMDKLWSTQIFPFSKHWQEKFLNQLH